MIFFRSSPEEDPWISKDELEYITKNLADKSGETEGADSERQALVQKDAAGPADGATPPVPWFAIFTSMPMWAIIVGHTVANWGFYNMLVCMPQYLKDVLNLDISTLGFISSVPYVVMWFAAIVTGQVAASQSHLDLNLTPIQFVCCEIY